MSRTHASSCSWSSTRVSPVTGSTATIQRSLLSADRTEATAWRPSRETIGSVQRTSRYFASGDGDGDGEGGDGSGDGAGDGDGEGFGAGAGPANAALAQTLFPVCRSITASRRRSWASPTLVRAALLSA